MLKVVENCGTERQATERELINQLFSPATCNRTLVDELAAKLEPKAPELTLLSFANSNEQ